ncbi:hypothetical protein BRADI_1g13512v3 [Brachypodium distachyon]|uniref:Cathepsin propeptide inhibitor domain-containing protein n=1 Tax=Brachypodium distachyon TaxID=15368 RepID=A0A0Q3GSV6_BRADI|nr:hypothetical protein BRADI_1g13512v3 [Brachypodium distachyon]KQK13944.1 hypothetical protein BRADI_1g13512v3 [Brachypodium distachyon]PNT74377.1 hypothetical protein BRADI_1g13512v3 [Brachypodium distachyon]PNT74378.1 hypothetical protein BRADI_1g13512v3 [Brachypodium distachyon]
MARWAVVALVVVAMALGTAQANLFTFTEEDIASEDSMWALYERWVAHHEEVRDHDEMTRRFPVFKKNARWIHDYKPQLPPFKKNTLRIPGNGKMVLNIFGDMSHEELANMTNCCIEKDLEFLLPRPLPL